MPGVAEMLEVLNVEAMFPDGAKMITVHQPIRPGTQAIDAAAPAPARSSPPTARSNSMPAAAASRCG